MFVLMSPRYNFYKILCVLYIQKPLEVILYAVFHIVILTLY